MDELRWFLLILGVLVILVVYGYGRVQDWRHDGPPWRRPRRREREPFADEPLSGEDIEGALNELDDLITEQRTEPYPAGGAAERSGAAGDYAEDPDAEPTPAAPARGRPGPESGRVAAGSGDGAAGAVREPPEAAAADEKIVVINVAAPAGHRFTGPGLIGALEGAGLCYGEHGIYHRELQTRTGTVALFSVASMVEPGWFDLDNMDGIETPGVAFFLRLPGPFDGLAAFEQMLKAARDVAAELGGQLLDGRRCDLTQQTVEHIREDLLEYRRRAHLAARAR